MKDVLKALIALFRSTGLPVCMNGHVPNDTAFPYITIETLKGDAFSSNIMFANIWFKEDDYATANGKRLIYANTIKSLIPVEGAKIKLENEGYIILHRESNFLSMIDDVEDDVIGLHITYQIKFLTT